ncbi:MAG: PHP domain-containing protein [Endomicrobiales bacterium]|nr:PHP domain-containing protein [Endomicrobiales bacterium]
MTDLYADLHLHTNHSDGSFSPKEVVKRAKTVGLCAIAITDHDTTDGIDEAKEEGLLSNIEVISGVELSAETTDDKKREIHILGYCIEHKSGPLQEYLKKFQDARTKRAYAILEKLRKLNITLDEAELFAMIKPGGSIGRLHFAKALIKNSYSRSINDAFENYLSVGRAAYVPKFALTPSEAVKIINDAGGVAVLAHPSFSLDSNSPLLIELIKDGLKGIEAWHSRHSPSAQKHFKQLAQENGLIATGGSDCHGQMPHHDPLIGKVKIDYTIVTELKKLAAAGKQL